MYSFGNLRQPTITFDTLRQPSRLFLTTFGNLRQPSATYDNLRQLSTVFRAAFDNYMYVCMYYVCMYVSKDVYM